MRKLTGLDVALIVLGGIQLVLTISLYGVCGTIGTETNIIFDYVTLSNLGTASWLLLVCILAIYISTIIISIFAILFTLGAAIVSTLGLFGIFNFVSSYVSLYSSTLSRVYGNAFGNAFGSSSSTSGVLE
ncbi:hypothetical protein EB796_001862 [Bugula neritina]|uniref:Uncharacterized protein n=1 Tax=Bugula neritina TaxID=10212 RepID=A0A7J7KNT0_BUGNE|nr:hypothetical protein EB796_001862 [Bugula neritina]